MHTRMAEGGWIVAVQSTLRTRVILGQFHAASARAAIFHEPRVQTKPSFFAVLAAVALGPVCLATTWAEALGNGRGALRAVPCPTCSCRKRNFAYVREEGCQTRGDIIIISENGFIS